MCGARNGGSVMSTRLWCSYMVESAVVLCERVPKMRYGVRAGEVLLRSGGILGTVFPPLQLEMGLSPYNAARMRDWAEGMLEGG